MKRLQDKVIIITGGSGLLGKSIVENVKSEGGLAINADINVETDLSKGNIHTDITSDDSIQETIDAVVSEFGRIDGLVNNAYPRTDDWGNGFEEVSPESWRKNIDWQLNSSYIFCHKLFVQMKLQKSGAIVNIASMYGEVGPDFSIYKGTDMTAVPGYFAIKGGIINLTRYLAAYFGKYGIRINCVSPGGIFDNQAEAFVKKYEEKVPLKRMGLPDDIAPPVSFLLSDEAKYITGHNLLVDGGWTAI